MIQLSTLWNQEFKTDIARFPYILDAAKHKEQANNLLLTFTAIHITNNYWKQQTA